MSILHAILNEKVALYNCSVLYSHQLFIIKYYLCHGHEGCMYVLKALRHRALRALRRRAFNLDIHPECT